MGHHLKVKMTELSLIKEDSTSYQKQGRFNKLVSGVTTENQYSVATRLAGERLIWGDQLDQEINILFY
jgi:hypothetical protein